MQKNKRFVTPIGLSNYTYIDKPDTKFDTEGTYHGEVLCTYTDAVDLLTKLDILFDEFYDEMLKEKKLKKMNIYSRGYEEFVGEDAEKYIKFKFKTKATITTKKGETFARVVPVYDKAGHVIETVSAIGNGSMIRVSFEVIPYYTGMVGFGLTLRLVALQVLDLIPYEYDSFDTFGFTIEEEEDADESTSGREIPFEV